MRTKLLMTAATAAMLAWGASADTTRIDENRGDYERPHLDSPDMAAMANPTEAEFLKDDPDLEYLFDTLELDSPEDENGFQQQARIQQDGNANDANVDQTDSEEGLAHIRQTGDGNEANVSQADDMNNGPAPNPPLTFTGPTNIAIIGQTGDSNEANIDQHNTSTAGASNLADIHQFSEEDSDELDGNTATIVQGDVDGDSGRALTARIIQGDIDARSENNDATIMQDGLAAPTVSVTALVDQQSDGSSTTIVQTTVDDAKVIVNQTGYDGAADTAANIASITQSDGTDLTVGLVQTNEGLGFNPGGTENDATIFQSGTDLTISASQEYDDNVLDIRQYGEANEIKTEQSDEGGFTSNEINIVQDGYENDISVLQTNAPSIANINQEGDYNVIMVEQDASGANVVGGFTNRADVDQLGYDNDVSVLQQNDGNIADVDQDGSYNAIKLEQRDNTDNGINRATLTQTADVYSSSMNVLQQDAENFVNATQTDGYGLTMNIDQSGDASTLFGFGDVNAAEVTQSGGDSSINVRQQASNEPFVAIPPTNVVSLVQDAYYSDIYVEQVGEGNEVGTFGAPVQQIGDYLLLEVRQNGNSNSVSGTQTGEYNVLTIDQDGIANEVTFDQAGYENEGVITQDGNFNSVELNQAQGWNTAVIYQDGNGNNAFVDQTVGNTQLAVVNQIGNGNMVNVTQ